MSTLYIDCGMGAAGDMLTAALLELLPDQDEFVKELNALEIPGVHFEREPAVKCGITGTHMKVLVHGMEEGEEHHHHEHEHDHEDHCHDHEHHHDHDHEDHHHHHDHDHHHEHDHEDHHHHEHDHEDHHHEHEHDHHHEHHHASMHDIEHIVCDHMHVSKKVQEDVLAVYQLIAEAESHAHGRPVSEIHFHEVGTMDAIADVTAVCMLMEKLRPDEVVVSPIHVGSGQVKCAHGILPVPAPATAFILRDCPIYGGEIKGELCTPTGAALLKHFATRFGSMPMMSVKSIGYGMGKKDFPVANCVRVMYGEGLNHAKHDDQESALKAQAESNGAGMGDNGNEIYELSCNVDDMTGEAVGFAMERLFELGARDVFTIPIGMKKSRPGILIRVICAGKEKERIIQGIFKYTTTIGIREVPVNRHTLDREIQQVETPYGKVRCKVSTGYGVTRRKYEFEDIARIAREHDLSLNWINECNPKY